MMEGGNFGILENKWENHPGSLESYKLSFISHHDS